MKTIFLIFFLFSGAAMAQSNKPAGDLPNDEPSCPPGFCPVLNINLEMFNFHKPRTSCTTGFGLCVRFSTGVTCEFCIRKNAIVEGKVITTAYLKNDEVELHLPMAMQNEKEFATTDMSVFEIEDGSWTITDQTGKVYDIKGGVYPVKVEGDDMVVAIPLR